MDNSKIYIMSSGASGQWSVDAELPTFCLSDMDTACRVASTMAALHPEYRWRASTGDVIAHESVEDARVILADYAMSR